MSGCFESGNELRFCIMKGNSWVAEGLFPLVAVSACHVKHSELLWHYSELSVPESHYGQCSKVCVWNVSTISQHDVQGF